MFSLFLFISILNTLRLSCYLKYSIQNEPITPFLFGEHSLSQKNVQINHFLFCINYSSMDDKILKNQGNYIYLPLGTNIKGTVVNQITYSVNGVSLKIGVVVGLFSTFVITKT